MQELAGKVAVVTGAASGIGLALCEAFAAEGMHIAMADVDPAGLDAAAERLADDTGAEVLAVPTDVMKWDEVAALEARAVARFGAVHVLCNNAGVQLPGVTWEFTRQEWEWVLGVNLGGVVHGIEAFVRGMVERGEHGHVVNTASVGGLVAFPGLAPYTAAKYAVVGLSECLEHDLRARDVPIGVSVLCPGPVLSSLRENSAVLRPGGASGRIVPLVTSVPKLAAAEVAAQVVDAIRHDRFWILTHPGYKETIRERCRGIVETDTLVVPELLST
jgi:NAD(P)-dependent dehydrogenase (short-subunit alcohol dehydrogenase family)